MRFTKKETESLKTILKKIEAEQKKEKIRIKERRKMQKQGKSLNKGKVRKQSRPARSRKRITRRT